MSYRTNEPTFTVIAALVIGFICVVAMLIPAADRFINGPHPERAWVVRR